MLPLKYSGEINGVEFKDLMLAQVWREISKLVDDKDFYDLCTEWELEKGAFSGNRVVEIKNYPGDVQIKIDVTGVADFAGDGTIVVKVGKKRFKGEVAKLNDWLIAQKLPHREIMTSLSLAYDAGHCAGCFSTPVSDIEISWDYL